MSQDADNTDIELLRAGRKRMENQAKNIVRLPMQCYGEIQMDQMDQGRSTL